MCLPLRRGHQSVREVSAYRECVMQPIGPLDCSSFVEDGRKGGQGGGGGGERTGGWE